MYLAATNRKRTALILGFKLTFKENFNLPQTTSALSNCFAFQNAQSLFVFGDFSVSELNPQQDLVWIYLCFFFVYIFSLIPTVLFIKDN